MVSQEVADEYCELSEGWHVSLATNHSVLVLMRITVQIREF